MLIDTHAHLNFSAFKDDYDEVIKRCLDGGVKVINVGTKYETSKRAVEIAQKYEKGIYAAVGLHPAHLEERKMDPAELDFQGRFKTSSEKFDYRKYKELVSDKKVVAIGEAGLDYYWKPKTQKKLEEFKQKQKETLLLQLKLAEELGLPVIFHCRMAHQDLIEILKSRKLQGVMHCFVGTLEQLREYLAMGFYIGFDGIIFKKIEGINFEEIIKNTPLDKILVETDCPYLIPTLATNFCEAKASKDEGKLRRRQTSSPKDRNEPLYVKYVAEKIAQIKGVSFEEIARTTTENAIKLFPLTRRR